MGNFVSRAISQIRERVGPRDQVLGAVSGGVDSTVLARLMTEAIGHRFRAVLVDTGVMRLGEVDQVRQTLTESLGIELTVADASAEFLEGLKGVVEPERKRKFIGGKFIDVFEAEAKKIEEAAAHDSEAGPVTWFAQGTLQSDVIER